jgi:hypothetical protein
MLMRVLEWRYFSVVTKAGSGVLPGELDGVILSGSGAALVSAAEMMRARDGNAVPLPPSSLPGKSHDPSCEFYADSAIDLAQTMTVATTDYVDVGERSRELGCRAPVGVALLPGNFATAAGAAELRYHEAAPEVRSAWRRVGLIDAGPNSLLQQNLTRDLGPEGADIPLVVYFGRALRSCPPWFITFALGAVASVVSGLPGQRGAAEIRLEAIVERSDCGTYARIEYSGDACELVGLAGQIRQILESKPGLTLDDAIGV